MRVDPLYRYFLFLLALKLSETAFISMHQHEDRREYVQVSAPVNCALQFWCLDRQTSRALMLVADDARK